MNNNIWYTCTIFVYTTELHALSAAGSQVLQPNRERFVQKKSKEAAYDNH